MKKKTDLYGSSYTGGRKENQDRIISIKNNKKDIYLIAVADGMGGHQFGDKAAEITIHYLKDMFEKEIFSENKHFINRSNLRQTIVNANEAINKFAIEKGLNNDVGTTLTGAFCIGGSYYLFNVGDSRTYTIDNNNIRQQTKDHTADNDAFEKGVISKEEIGKTAYSNALMNALGTGSDVVVDVFPKKESTAFPLDDDLIIFSCSDGLWGRVTEEEIKLNFINRKNLKESIENVISLAYINKSRDNISGVALEFGKLKRSKSILKSHTSMEKLLNNEKIKRKRLYYLFIILVFILIAFTTTIVYNFSIMKPVNNIGNEMLKKLEITQNGSILKWSELSKKALYKVILFDSEGNQIYLEEHYSRLTHFNLNKVNKIKKNSHYFINIMVKLDNKVKAALEGLGKEITIK